ncbi:MAG: MltA domain-containing protein [Planctomycetota bacterium]
MRAALVDCCLALLLVAALCSCARPLRPDYARTLPDGAHALARIDDPARIPDLRPLFARRDGALAALDESLDYFAKPSSQKHFPYQAGDRTIRHEDQVQTLLLLRQILENATHAEQLARELRDRFDFYRSVGWDNGSGEVLVTAYYTPIFQGRTQPDARFRYPLYRRPRDLIATPDGQSLGRRTDDGRVVPYYTRQEIESQQLLAGQELVYLTDPFDAFIVHVQGSAWIKTETGDMHVGYAGKTDRPYHSIGQELIRRGKIRDEELSLSRLRRYFREHPSELDVLNANPSYVFFTETEPGAFGSLGAPVTPYHTVATDKSVFPRGGPVLVSASRLGDGREPFLGLCFDQDTGGAIRSAGRADLYVGVGPAAEQLAGHTRSVGGLIYFFVKP